MSNTNESLTSLAATISETTNAITSVLENNNYPTPSFSEDGPLDYPKLPEVMDLRFKLRDAVMDLYRLSMGPSDMAFIHPLYANFDAMILDTFNQFNFWDAVPLGGSATIHEVSQKTTLPLSLVRRLLAYAIPSRIFAHGPSGTDTIVHTSLSACLVKKPLFRPWLTHNLEDIRPGIIHTPESFRKYSAGRDKETEESLESGFALADHDRLGRPCGVWEYLGREVEGKPKGYRAQTFAQAMQAAASASAIRVEDVLRTGYDWGSLGEATVIDIGGSGGYDARAISQAFPKLNFIIQDLSDAEAQFCENIPEAETSRIKFETRDFFGPQNTKGDVFMLKQVLHDWSDKYAIKILAPLLPHLKSGSRLLLCDSILPSADAPLPSTMRRLLACSDFQVMCGLGGLERTLEQWKTLLQQVDPGLRVTYVSNVPGSIHNFIEVKFIK